MCWICLCFWVPGCLAASLACAAFGPWLASVALVTFWLLAFVAFCSYSTLAMLTWNNILLFHCYLILSFICRLFHLLWPFDQDMANSKHMQKLLHYYRTGTNG